MQRKLGKFVGNDAIFGRVDQQAGQHNAAEHLVHRLNFIVGAELALLIPTA
ncbi:hypothetical protein L915_10910 [Phytophthora nicotianae]|uniref:Uncharacterized protein n=1 Tax=Phytophthora nicotianae TaxID=4792 RepID=W2ITH8_PHYNI|nr:hypothetical protein L915_10910 [Phytophthora nicotianae]ETL37514.1 hypothetical protein L916_10804 [Phytophthora nicotianae]